VLLGWVVVLALVVVSAGAFSGQFSEKFEVPGTESQRAQELLYCARRGQGMMERPIAHNRPAALD
jgi:hypothetical protein